MPQLKLGLRGVLTALCRRYGIENITLVKAVWIGLKLVGLFYSRTFLLGLFTLGLFVAPLL